MDISTFSPLQTIMAESLRVLVSTPNAELPGQNKTFSTLMSIEQSSNANDPLIGIQPVPERFLLGILHGDAGENSRQYQALANLINPNNPIQLSDGERYFICDPYIFISLPEYGVVSELSAQNPLNIDLTHKIRHELANNDIFACNVSIKEAELHKSIEQIDHTIKEHTTHKSRMFLQSLIPTLISTIYKSTQGGFDILGSLLTSQQRDQAINMSNVNKSVDNLQQILTKIKNIDILKDDFDEKGRRVGIKELAVVRDKTTFVRQNSLLDGALSNQHSLVVERLSQIIDGYHSFLIMLFTNFNDCISKIIQAYIKFIMSMYEQLQKFIKDNTLTANVIENIQQLLSYCRGNTDKALKYAIFYMLAYTVRASGIIRPQLRTCIQLNAFFFDNDRRKMANATIGREFATNYNEFHQANIPELQKSDTIYTGPISSQRALDYDAFYRALIPNLQQSGGTTYAGPMVSQFPAAPDMRDPYDPSSDDDSMIDPMSIVGSTWWSSKRHHYRKPLCFGPTVAPYYLPRTNYRYYPMTYPPFYYSPYNSMSKYY